MRTRLALALALAALALTSAPAAANTTAPTVSPTNPDSPACRAWAPPSPPMHSCPRSWPVQTGPVITAAPVLPGQTTTTVYWPCGGPVETQRCYDEAMAATATTTAAPPPPPPVVATRPRPVAPTSTTAAAPVPSAADQPIRWFRLGDRLVG